MMYFEHFKSDLCYLLRPLVFEDDIEHLEIFIGHHILYLAVLLHLISIVQYRTTEYLIDTISNDLWDVGTQYFLSECQCSYCLKHKRVNIIKSIKASTISMTISIGQKQDLLYFCCLRESLDNLPSLPVSYRTLSLATLHHLVRYVQRVPAL